MAVYVLSGRNVRCFWAQHTDQLITDSLNFSGILAKSGGISDTYITGWRGFPYVQSVRFTTEGGLENITSVGVENIAAIEEVGIGFQEVTIEVIAQPNNDFKDLVKLCYRDPSLNVFHLPYNGLRFFVLGAYEPGTGSVNYKIDIWAGVLRRFEFTQPADGWATARFTFASNFIDIQKFTGDWRSGGTYPGTGFWQSYDLSSGVLNSFEAVLSFLDPSTNNPLPQFANYSLEISSFEFSVNTTVTPFHTFLAQSLTDASRRAALRLWRMVMDAVQTVEGGFTAYLPPDVGGSLNVHALPVSKIRVQYYAYAGTAAISDSSLPGTPVLTFEFPYTKFLSAGTSFAPDRAVQFDVRFQAFNPSGMAWSIS